MHARLLASSTAAPGTCCLHSPVARCSDAASQHAERGLSSRRALCGAAGRLQRRPPFCGSHRRGAAGLKCRASGDDTSDTPVQDRIRDTLTGLDALLGIDPEEEENKKVRRSCGCNWSAAPRSMQQTCIITHHNRSGCKCRTILLIVKHVSPVQHTRQLAAHACRDHLAISYTLHPLHAPAQRTSNNILASHTLHPLHAAAQRKADELCSWCLTCRMCCCCAEESR